MDIRESLKTIPEPRMKRCRKHELVDILLLCIIAMVCGVKDVENTVYFGEANKQWLKKYLKLENGIPCADTILRLLSRIDSKIFETTFRKWIGGYFREQSVEGTLIAIDGKTIRGSIQAQQKAIHVVSAWADELQLVLGQVRTQEKSNEITAIPELLEALDIKGCIITIDAMGCQKQIASRIVDKGGGYVLSLKENHPVVYEEVQRFFADTQNNDIPIQQHSQVTKDHGRVENRQASLCTRIDWFADRDKWAGIKGIGCISSSRTVSGRTTVENRYYLTTLTDAKQFANAVRRHWGIENSLHWSLDVTFREDYARNRKDHSAANLAVIRKIVLNLLRMEKTEYQVLQRKHKMTLGRKQMYAAYNPEFRISILINL